MNRALNIFLLLFLLSFVSGCFGLFDSEGSDKIVDDYTVQYVDAAEYRTLNKGEGLIPAYVFAVGHNDRFIFAKQYPVSNSKEKIDKKTINYYIIERTKSEFQDKPKYGPLTKRDFDTLCSNLKIINPQFNISYSTDF